ncbi:acyl-CoA desaturase [Cycloclasticus sp. P1]|uniref:acyl-CoA desaturase n=1 Tax=Cycloclasticus sp. (strain P1) TaxID=385025 RepID=UPI000286A933|nr:acyl-CoA desaturase [Cycloclasticus sp. P1]AFT66693.1 Fatty acid desaturase subfamily [Cycloclasticus sp. P1]
MRLLNRLKPMLVWFDTQSGLESVATKDSNKLGWAQVTPFVFMHLMVFAVVWVGFSWVALWGAIFLYLVRMFAITGFYHRYFSHKLFKTSRFIQFFFAFMGASAAQRGPLWWASHHRVHHQASDKEGDPHSPRLQGFIWSHCLWFLAPKNLQTKTDKVKDFNKFPELRWLDRFDITAPLVLIVALYCTGFLMEIYYPQLETTGAQMVIWGFFISTVALYHGTYTINSLAHCFGSRRFDTPDDSRNNALLAIITLGEGWHNNHHFYPGSARQGFLWWEFDMTFYVLKVMSWCGLVWDLKPIPLEVQKEIKRK